jgi:ABC-type amino acid transport substrate-binding protein
LLLCIGLPAFPQAQSTQSTGTPSTPQNIYDIRSIVSSGILRVAISRFDIPPFHRHRANGTIVGKEAELTYQIAQALNVKVVFVDEARTYDEVIKLVADGRADIGLNALSQNYGAVVNVRFSAPYMTLRHALLYNRQMVAQEAAGGPPEDVLREFRGKIGVIASSPFVGFADRNFALATIVEYPTWKEAVDGLLNQEVDLLYNNEFEVRRILKDNPAFHVSYGAAIMKDRLSFIAIAICDSCAKLQEFINYFIAQNRAILSVDELLATPGTH